MKRHWFKFYGQDFITDPKMLVLTSAQKIMWITLLSLVSTSEEEGVVKNITEDRLKILSHIDYNSQVDDEWTQTTGTLKKFEELNMIEIKGETITVSNFLKRQVAQDSYDPDAVKERVRKHRSLQSVTVTTEERRGEEIRGDKKEDATVVAGIVKLLKTFEEKNPSVKRMYGNKSQRDAGARLIKQFGVDDVINRAKFALTILGMPYAPRVTTPYLLETKWADLEAFYHEQKGKQQKGGVVL